MVVGHLHSSALSFAPEKFSMCNKTSVARIRFRKMELFSWQAHFGEGTKSTFRVWWGIVRQRLVNILLKRNQLTVLRPEREGVAETVETKRGGFPHVHPSWRGFAGGGRGAVGRAAADGPDARWSGERGVPRWVVLSVTLNKERDLSSSAVPERRPHRFLWMKSIRAGLILPSFPLKETLLGREQI